MTRTDSKGNAGEIRKCWRDKTVLCVDCGREVTQLYIITKTHKTVPLNGRILLSVCKKKLKNKEISVNEDFLSITEI